MSDETHGEHCREKRAHSHGHLIMSLAISMVRGIRCDDEGETDDEIAEATEYVIDALVQLALCHENPRQMLEQAIHRIDSYPVEKIVEIMAKNEAGG
jgi:hypothetical protein